MKCKILRATHFTNCTDFFLKYIVADNFQTSDRYQRVLVNPPIPQRQNKRMLRFKPYFNLPSRPEIERRKKAMENKIITAQKNAAVIKKKAEAVVNKLQKNASAYMYFMNLNKSELLPPNNTAPCNQLIYL